METLLEPVPVDALTLLLAAGDMPLDQITPELMALFVIPLLDDIDIPVARFGSAI